MSVGIGRPKVIVPERREGMLVPVFESQSEVRISTSVR